jgi:hypothetical protein
MCGHSTCEPSRVSSSSSAFAQHTFKTYDAYYPIQEKAPDASIECLYNDTISGLVTKKIKDFEPGDLRMAYLRYIALKLMPRTPDEQPPKR